METDLKKIFGYTGMGIGISVFVGGLLFLGFFLNWMTTNILWNTLISPIFHLQTLTIAQSAALSLFISWYMPVVEADKEKHGWVYYVAKFITRYGVTLGLGYILSFYI